MLPPFFHLLDGEHESLAVVDLLPRLKDCCLCLVDLPLDIGFLTLRRKGNPFELGLADDDCIVIARCNPCAELFPVVLLEILFRRDQDVRAGIQMQKFVRPLEGQMVRHNDHGFPAQAETFALHGGGCHRIGFSSSDLVRQQGVVPEKDVCNRVSLMLPQINAGIHPWEGQVFSGKFHWPQRVEFLVVLRLQFMPPVRILPDPFAEGFLDEALLLLRKQRFPLIDHFRLFVDRVIDCDLRHVQGFFNDLIGIHAAGSVLHGDGHALHHRGFPQDLPAAGLRAEHDFDRSALSPCEPECLVHEVLDVLRIDPGCA